ncbi:long-chain fatty acid--CoA ligase [Chloroflexota bacterium]
MLEEKPWLGHYDKGVPPTLHPYPVRTLIDVVSKAAHQRSDHHALLFQGAHLSYNELDRLSDAFAAALVDQGIQKGDRVALLLPNCPQFIIAELGVWKAGAIAALINPLYTENELKHMLEECGAKTAVVLSRFYEKIQPLCQCTELSCIIAANIKTYLPPFLRFLFTLFREKKDGHRTKLREDDLWMGDLLCKFADAPQPNVMVGPDDPALLLFTGGTTGTPKAAVGTHGGLMATGMQLNAWFGVELIDWDDVILLCMPLFHVYGVGILSTALIGHNPLALVPNPRDLKDLIATIRRTHPAFVPGVPTLFDALLNHTDIQTGKVDFKSIKLCISGASPLLLETKRRFETITGGRMVEVYALTESMGAAVISPVHGEYRSGAVGLPVPDVDIRIVDAHTGQGELTSGEVGEVLIRAPQVMQSYWRRPDETKAILRDGWLHTGDLGYLDKDGYLFIVDRMKDLIKPSGFQVWPREVEEVIASHPAVYQVGVAGVPDPYQGEAVKAWIVLRKGRQITIDELRTYCRKELVAYKVPKHVEFRNTLPMSHYGKVLRRELVAQEKR